MGDGLGTDYQSKDKFTEDFMILNGKHYKLDITRLSDLHEDSLTATHYFKTIDIEDRIYPKDGCDLKFEPISPELTPPRDGLDFIFLTFV